MRGTARTGGVTLYDPSYPEEARKHFANGGTVHGIGKRFGVAVSTIWSWRERYPEFAAAFRVGAEVADNLVELSLFEKATGYHYQEEVKTRELDENGQEVEKVTYLDKSLPPDNSAMFFWLKNRRGHKWKDKVEYTHNHNVVMLTDNDLQRLVTDASVIEGEFSVAGDKKEPAPAQEADPK